MRDYRAIVLVFKESSRRIWCPHAGLTPAFSLWQWAATSQQPLFSWRARCVLPHSVAGSELAEGRSAISTVRYSSVVAGKPWAPDPASAAAAAATAPAMACLDRQLSQHCWCHRSRWATRCFSVIWSTSAVSVSVKSCCCSILGHCAADLSEKHAPLEQDVLKCLCFPSTTMTIRQHRNSFVQFMNLSLKIDARCPCAEQLVVRVQKCDMASGLSFPILWSVAWYCSGQLKGSKDTSRCRT